MNHLSNLFPGAIGCLRGLAVAMLLPTTALAAADEAGGLPLAGVNMAGAEFGHKKLPGKFGQDYFYPEKHHFAYYRDKDIRLIRFPFRWERVQHTLNGRLDFEEVRRLKRALDLAAMNKQQVIVDMHNYARYHGDLIGTRSVPYSAFADVWRKLADALKGHPALYGYDIMNEPHSTVGRWPEAAQAAVDAIREVDRETLIFVEGDRWANSWYWTRFNGDLDIRDPADRIVYEAHVYFDEDFSGAYEDDEEVDPMLGVERVRPFVEWLRARGHKGFIGEYGVPDQSPSMLRAMDNLLAYLNEQCIPSAYWAAGPNWGNYRLAIEPRHQQDRPQMKVLEKHIGNNCAEIGPTPAPRSLSASND